MDSDTTTNEVIRGLDLTGATAVVTGGAGGLGLETARALAACGAHVVLGVRSNEKGLRATAEIVGQHPAASVSHGLLDLADLSSVREFASVTLERHPAIRVLVNNAGVMFTPLERTRDGFELQFGTNHLGHFLLTLLLVPELVRGAPSRVVTVSSGGHALSDIIWDDPNYRARTYDKFEAYGQSKTANILFTRELERRESARGVHAFAVHPGMVATDLGRHMTDEDTRVLAGMFESSGAAPEFKTVASGAATSVWAAVSPELDGEGGHYLADCSISHDDAAWTRDEASAARLWALSEELVGEVDHRTH